jgi:transketolase
MTPEERLRGWKLHESQRGYFGKALYETMAKDERIHVLTGDLGFGMFDAHREDFPSRFINCGASEQAMFGIAVGMALEGKIVFCYTITSFVLRAAETISLYAHHEQIPIKIIGGGRDDDYKHDGFSHDGTVAQDFIKRLKIESFYPKTNEEVGQMVRDIIVSGKPSFVSLKR